MRFKREKNKADVRSLPLCISLLKLIISFLLTRLKLIISFLLTRLKLIITFFDLLLRVLLIRSIQQRLAGLEFEHKMAKESISNMPSIAKKPEILPFGIAIKC